MPDRPPSSCTCSRRCAWAPPSPTLGPRREREVAVRRRALQRGQLGAGQRVGRGRTPRSPARLSPPGPLRRSSSTSSAARRSPPRDRGPSARTRRSPPLGVGRALRSTAARDPGRGKTRRRAVHQGAARGRRRHMGLPATRRRLGVVQRRSRHRRGHFTPGRHTLRPPADRRDARGDAPRDAGGRTDRHAWSTRTPTGTTATAMRSWPTRTSSRPPAAPRRWLQLPASAMAGVLRAAPTLGPAGAFLTRIFAPFSFDDIDTALPTATFEGRLDLSVADRPVTLLEVGPAHTAGDVVVHLPDDGVVFTGDILFHGGHPIVWAGPVANWVAACDRVLGLDASVIVPGHGPLADTVRRCRPQELFRVPHDRGASPPRRRDVAAWTRRWTSTSAPTPAGAKPRGWWPTSVPSTATSATSRRRTSSPSWARWRPWPNGAQAPSERHVRPHTSWSVP